MAIQLWRKFVNKGPQNQWKNSQSIHLTKLVKLAKVLVAFLSNEEHVSFSIAEFCIGLNGL